VVKKVWPILLFFWLLPGAVFGFSHEDLVPFLNVELPGFVGDKIDGFTGMMGLTQAAREYVRGNSDVRFAASIMVGIVPSTLNQQFSQVGGAKNSHFYQTKVKGFKVTVAKDSIDCSPCGAIIIHLNKQANFLVNYEHISDKEALELIKRFDLKGLSKLTQNVRVPAPSGGGMKFPGMPESGGNDDSGDIGY